MILGDNDVDRNRNRRIEQLFHAAIEQPASRRSAFLANVCADDPKLRREVQALLAADDTDDNILDTPACETVMPSNLGLGLTCGERIGAYEIVRLIGSGGMGNVYEAVQDQPRRTVALKLLRTTLASDSELRRFRYESELLGRLRHPNIAQVYEAGIHNDGPFSVPYFAMEYVPDASSIIDYSQAATSDMRERLELFIQVCDAVQHGHSKGIVHRDLKPGNILVDAAGVPKVIDYGVARGMDAELPITTMRTSVDALIGTLQYMSPEQLACEKGDVDTRSDVYALGLILYELLTGERPYDLNGRRLSDAIRAVEAMPCPTMGSIKRELCGDISTIVAKALEKERARRYQSPSALASDIRRFLRKEPIDARPPSATYRMRKFSERNKPLVAAGVLALIAMVAGLAVAGWQFRNATTERDHARLEAHKATHISAFLQSMLASADPRQSNADVTIRQALDRASTSIEAELADEPRVYADVHATIGSIYERLNLHEEAAHHLRVALATRTRLFGKQSREVADTMSDLAWSVGCSNPRERGQLALDALAIYRGLYGDHHRKTAIQEVDLADFKVAAGDYAAAETFARKSLDTLRQTNHKDDEATAFAMKTLAESLQGQGRLDEAEQAFRDALRVNRKVYESDHYELGIMLSSMGRFLSQINKNEEAAALKAEAAKIRAQRVGRARRTFESSCLDRNRTDQQ